MRAVGVSYAVSETILRSVKLAGCDFLARMSGTVIFPLPALGAVLMSPSGAAPAWRDAALPYGIYCNTPIKAPARC